MGRTPAPSGNRPGADRPANPGPRPAGPRRENAPRDYDLRKADRTMREDRGDDREDPRASLAAPLIEGIPAPFEVLFGMNPIREALLAGRRKFRRIYIARREESPEMAEILKLAKERTVQVTHVEREQLDALVAVSATTEQGGQGIAMAVTPYRYFSLEELAGPKEERGAKGSRRRLLALDEIEDPRNLGAMARTAEAAGFRGLLVQEHRAAAVTPTSVKASAGAVEHLRVARETNLASSLERLKDLGYWIVGLDAAPDASDIYDVDLDMDLVLVIGAEGRGIRPRVRSICDLRVRLPMGGKVGSLNASAACAAAVYQVLRADSAK